MANKRPDLLTALKRHRHLVAWLSLVLLLLLFALTFVLQFWLLITIENELCTRLFHFVTIYRPPHKCSLKPIVNMYMFEWLLKVLFLVFFLLSTTIKTDDLIFSVLVIDCALKHVRPLNRTTSTGFHFIFGERKTMACKSWMLQSHLRVTGRTLLPKRVCCLVLCCSHFGSVC